MPLPWVPVPPHATTGTGSQAEQEYRQTRTCSASVLLHELYPTIMSPQPLAKTSRHSMSAGFAGCARQELDQVWVRKSPGLAEHRAHWAHPCHTTRSSIKHCHQSAPFLSLALSPKSTHNFLLNSFFFCLILFIFGCCIAEEQGCGCYFHLRE